MTTAILLGMLVGAASLFYAVAKRAAAAQRRRTRRRRGMAAQAERYRQSEQGCWP